MRLPNNWTPRPYQQRLWEYLLDGGKRAVACWHRRSGKDDVCLHHTACAVHERRGNYWHMLPEAAQLRKALWSAVNPHSGLRRLDEAFPMALRQATNKQEMSIEFRSGSTWQGVGSDNFNSLIGSPPVGVIWSEWSVANPLSWAYLSPILEENGGWAIFPYTPRGENHGQSLYETAKADRAWFAEKLTVDDTGLFSQAQLDQILADLKKVHHSDVIAEALFRQEYYCSFSAPVLGAIYADAMETAEREGRIRALPYDNVLPVYTAWDLGHSDATAIWWFQVGMEGVRVIDWYESCQQDLAHYAGVVLGRRCEISTAGGIQIAPGVLDHAHMHRISYHYGGHYLPPDARQKHLAAAGLSIEEQLATILPLTQVIDVPNDLQQCIQATRAVFPRVYFDDKRTLEGRRRLRQYRYSHDEKTNTLSAKPVHDWTSHSSTAFHVLAHAWRPYTEPQRLTSKGQRAGWKV